MDVSQIDLQQLRVKHIFFKTKVRALLYGGTYDEALFSDKSPVTAWLNTTGKQRYAHYPETSELASLHQGLIILAQSLYRQYCSGNIEQAHEMLKDMDQQSERFLVLLSKVEQEVLGNTIAGADAR
ncbi:CZB domain-containing protein [Pontibacter sp. SGAir0037]|uniref:CZB domain-containing protein n=1 Tax=Pontibacter sp. SGAir0037 TaxID=2571030 RepID=UPI0010CD2315|nr:CZB domain-containing protein [Pontibacter sp. SGAir0037]QCR24655.1 histidine kinase [Pontibacter sp. SGAir0037]